MTDLHEFAASVRDATPEQLAAFAAYRPRLAADELPELDPPAPTGAFTTAVAVLAAVGAGIIFLTGA